MHRSYRRAGEELDTAGAATLTAMAAIIAAPEHWVEVHLERRQQVYSNNRQCAYVHTTADDAPGAAARPLLRLWHCELA